MTNNLSYDNPWTYEGPEVLLPPPEGVIGFVYMITNQVTGMKYIGKKLFVASKIKQVKGKKKKIKVESDWKSYWGSNGILIAEISEFNSINNYKREILRLCTTKSELSYYETKEIFERDALLKDEFYNQWVSCKIHKKNLVKTRKL